ncbi:MAG: hypothetical protein ACQERN_12585 [Thermodesulfobacteriota bacterium]
MSNLCARRPHAAQARHPGAIGKELLDYPGPCLVIFETRPHWLRFAIGYRSRDNSIQNKGNTVIRKNFSYLFISSKKDFGKVCKYPKKDVASSVMPAKAGIQGFSVRLENWIPAFAGMTDGTNCFLVLVWVLRRPEFTSQNHNWNIPDNLEKEICR